MIKYANDTCDSKDRMNLQQMFTVSTCHGKNCYWHMFCSWRQYFTKHVYTLMYSDTSWFNSCLFVYILNRVCCIIAYLPCLSNPWNRCDHRIYYSTVQISLVLNISICLKRPLNRAWLNDRKVIATRNCVVFCWCFFFVFLLKCKNAIMEFEIISFLINKTEYMI